ncbi:diguanylate cyclase [Rhodoferax sp.]|uniref:diguanylate cyclase n=1 Tax=Rhodoferax sp. TaxID=50421 RepID=UPI0027169D44|nr:diguanylate cyclase [Rhodoferax sp.]MDO9142780.1 diguanylate cyclase [Rhodoferax sp.]MDP1529712.1 diguanylate cyclase [Rhodoferax sp.]MDP1945309.1 diguanylate cyclase [Rhodoferax sp.]MDP2441393.1 diguanylate cyclase [Rhodoferax sp.]MDP3866120.1 diguanylate cyclase [Rhodoferax sp.]
MDDKLKAAATARLAQLRNDYLARLPAELTALQTLGAGLSGGEPDRASLDELHHRLHKLAGSGGTFGLAALSAGAHTLEQRVKGWLADSLDELGDAQVRQAFSADLAALGATMSGVDVPLVSVTQAGDARAAPGESIRVWLVEDDILLGEELARQLGSFNYVVRRFTRIDDAERAARTECPDMLLMDVMFEQEGENATEVFALHPNLRALGCPLLFVTSYDDFMSRVRAAQLGALGYFLKPLDIPRLVSRMSQIFEQKRAPSQRVLIVDDDRDLAEHYRLALLAAGMEADVLEQPAAIMEKIAAFRPELVLMDMHMPGFSGPDLAGVIRQHDNWSSLPIVYLSAETDLDLQIKAMGRGADDFLTKPISDAQLVAAVRVRVERARQLEAQISRDSLTGLLKHASIKESAGTEVTRARRSGKPVSLAMLDIDHFKSVNDTYGHAVGDVVISSVAMLLRQRLRQSDIVGRYGGEEFVAVLPECDAGYAHELMEDIRQRFASLRFSHEGKDFGCTLSVGLACSLAYPDSDGAALLVAADEALYVAKRGGRNQVREASPS